MRTSHVWLVVMALGSAIGAGPLLTAATRLRCLQGCQCQLLDMEDLRFVDFSLPERRKAHLNVRCTRGHNITLNKFFAKVETLRLDLSQVAELTLEGLLVPTLRLSDFSRFTRLSVLNLPLNRISRLALKTTQTTTAKTATSAAAAAVNAMSLKAGVMRDEKRFVNGSSSRHGPMVDADADSVDKELESLLSRLSSLNLRENSVSRLDDSVLKKMKNLKVIDLSFNNLHFITENAFDGNQLLERLVLRDNFITIVPKLTYRPLKSLQILDLSRNQIFSIHNEAFSGCAVLRHLDLSSNLLSHLPRLLFETLPSQTRISIQSNPLQCACGMEWLLRLLEKRRTSFEFPDSIRCASPPDLADRSLTSLRHSIDDSENASIGAAFSASMSTNNVSSASELPCDEPDIRILGLSGLYSRTLPGSLYESLFGAKQLDLPPISQTAVVFVRDDAEFDCVVPPGIWPRPSILWQLPSGVQMAAVPHAHHIPQSLVDAANITDFKTILMKPLDSTHSVSVIPPGLLRLTDFRYPMAGNYSCFAISPAGNVSASITVDIQSAIWPTYISSLFISFAAASISIVIASAVGLVVLLVTHFENKKLASVGLDGTPPIYPTPEESPQLHHRILTIPVNAAMFENIKDGYDSFRSKIKTGLDRRMEKGRLLVELAWVSGETAITGLKEGTSTGIHKIDHVVRESGVALARGIQYGGATINKSIRDGGAVVSQAVYESVHAVKDNVLSLKDLCGGVPSSAAGSICGETSAIDFGEIIPGGGDILSLENPTAYDDDTTTIQVHHNPEEGANPAPGARPSKAESERKSRMKHEGKGKGSHKLQSIAEDGGGGRDNAGRSGSSGSSCGSDIRTGGSDSSISSGGKADESRNENANETGNNVEAAYGSDESAQNIPLGGGPDFPTVEMRGFEDCPARQSGADQTDRDIGDVEICESSA